MSCGTSKNNYTSFKEEIARKCVILPFENKS